jgi:hypothetical protein
MHPRPHDVHLIFMWCNRHLNPEHTKVAKHYNPKKLYTLILIEQHTSQAFHHVTILPLEDKSILWFYKIIIIILYILVYIILLYIISLYYII